MRQIEQLNEKRGQDQIILTIYEEQGRYTFALQCAVSRIIRAFYPHQIKDPYATPAQAKQAAIALLHSWTARTPAAKARLKEFGITFCDTQLEFNFEN